jgi:hypothetical protein
MSSKLIENMDQITQSVEAVVELLKYLGKSSQPLPEIVPLADGAQLTKSSKADCYYYTSPKGCTCPGFFYRHSCKHVKALACSSSRPRGQTIAETLDEHDRNLWMMPKSYRRMVRAAREEAEAEPLELIPKSRFRPVLPDEEV